MIFNVCVKLCDETLKSKKEMQEKFEKDFEQLRSFNAEREQQLLEDCEWKLREVYKDSKNMSTKLQVNDVKLLEVFINCSNKRCKEIKCRSLAGIST